MRDIVIIDNNCLVDCDKLMNVVYHTHLDEYDNTTTDMLIVVNGSLWIHTNNQIKLGDTWYDIHEKVRELTPVELMVDAIKIDGDTIGIVKYYGDEAELVFK